MSAGTHDIASRPALALAAARRLVVKIGSALLAAEDGEVRRPWLAALADDVARCRSRGQEVILVSSGAIAVGRRHLGLVGRRLRLEEQQAAAATGQIRLAHAYQEALARHGITVAQILLTPDDTEERRRHLNARATFGQLLALGAVPVVNENDTIATAEIRFGDNDRLAARVAQMTSADMLVLLSDIDGLYTADPRIDPNARHIPIVREVGARHRGDGRRGAARLQLGRHGHENRRCPHRDGCRLQHADRQRKNRRIRAGAARRDRGGGEGDLVSASERAALGAQGMDCRSGQSIRCSDRR